MDFLLKRERIVVEVKKTRSNLNQQKVISQLTEDVVRYRTHQDCGVLFCFVYDPDGICSNPTALENDLTRQTDGLSVVVRVQPKRS